MQKCEKIDDLISSQSRLEKPLDKPLLIYGGPAKTKAHIITRLIEKKFARVAIYSFDKSIKSYSQLIDAIEEDKSLFIVLDQFENAWDNEETVLWASKRKNIVIVANADDVPEKLNNFFTIKKYIK